MNIEAICTHLGIGPDTIRKRLARGWTLEQATSQPRYQPLVSRKVAERIKLRKGRDQGYRKPPVIYPLTPEQAEVNRLLQGWRR